MEAALARDDYKRELIKKDGVIKRPTVYEFALIYLKEQKKIWRHSTWVTRENAIRRFLSCQIGEKKIVDVTPLDIQQIRSSLYSRKYAESYIRKVLNIIHAFFEAAQQWEYITRNPTYGVQLPKISKRQLPRIETSQIIEWIDKMESKREQSIVALGFYALLRIGEVFGLTWGCIDFETDILYVDRQVTGGRVTDPKTPASRASVIIPEPLGIILREWRLQSQSQHWLFPGRPPTKPMDSTGWRKNHFTLPMRFHDLRHFGIIYLNEGGIPPDYISRQARHSSVSTTFDVYNEVSNRALQNRIKKMYHERRREIQ